MTTLGTLLVEVARANLCTDCLQLYLEALPEDKDQWINKTQELRAQYEKIKEMVRAPPCGSFPQHDEKIVKRSPEIAFCVSVSVEHYGLIFDNM